MSFFSCLSPVEARRFPRAALLLVSLPLLLTACGGSESETDPATDSADTPPAAAAPQAGSIVRGDPLAVIFLSPEFSVSPGSGEYLLSSTAPGAAQMANSAGAYMQVGVDMQNPFLLVSGTVSGSSGNGDYAVGSWSDGSYADAAGRGTILQPQQSAHYVVGRPWQLPAGEAMSCALQARTDPSAVHGNAAPGKLVSATASLSPDAHGTYLLDLKLGVSMDSGPVREFDIPQPGVELASEVQSNGIRLLTLPVGSDDNPMLALGYSVHYYANGDVSGVAVLSCTRSGDDPALARHGAVTAGG